MSFKASLPKFLFEMVGTMFLTMFFTSLNQAVILLSLTVISIFTFKISGSHLNPAVTLAHMVKKSDKKLPISSGIMYILGQIIGGIVGALLVNFYTLNLPVLEFYDSFFVRSLVNELCGSFFFIIFILILSDKRLGFTREPTM